EDEVAFLEALAPGELAAGPGDDADILVAHDHGSGGGRVRVQLDVGAADAGDLHLQEGAVLGDVGHREFPELGPARAGPHGRQYLFHSRSFADSSERGIFLLREGASPCAGGAAAAFRPAGRYCAATVPAVWVRASFESR